ncbi:hypothetical protein D3C75_576790 [compost metagenome]
MPYDTDKERASIFDGQRIRQLREDADLHCIDTSRGRIEASGSGTFYVHLDKSLFDISGMLRAVPTRVEAPHAAAAEGEYLSWLVNIQRAERRTVRMGTCGMSPVDIARTPLSAEEISRFKARTSGAKEIEALRLELVAAIQRKAKVAAAKQSAADLNDRYGTTAAATCAAPTDDLNPALNVPQRTRRTK